MSNVTDSTFEERSRLAEEFISADLVKDYPDYDPAVDGMLGQTIGELETFLTKHDLLIKRIGTGLISKFDPAVVNESEAAQAELTALGIEPQVFLDAITVAESGIASVLGW